MKQAIHLIQTISPSLLAVGLTLLVGCTPVDQQRGKAAISSSPASSQASAESIQLKQADGSTAFSLKFPADGAKLVDGNDAELARFTRDANQKIKIKNASDQTIGYIVTHAGYWKLENSDQTQELYVLRHQSDGDYKLESGMNQQLYRIKRRDYGFEIETPAQQSLYKVKAKDGKISLRNSADQTVLSTRSTLIPIAVACFGFDQLNREQQAGLAYAVHLAGGQ